MRIILRTFALASFVEILVILKAIGSQKVFSEGRRLYKLYRMVTQKVSTEVTKGQMAGFFPKVDVSINCTEGSLAARRKMLFLLPVFSTHYEDAPDLSATLRSFRVLYRRRE